MKYMDFQQTWHRSNRAVLVVLALMAVSLLAAGCATAPAVAAAPDIYILMAQGAPLTRQHAVSALRQADHVLLGELHDNPVHHRERAAVLAALADRRPTVVFEQFPRSADAALATPVGADVGAWVAKAGFDLKGWAWPLHQPVIDAALAAGLPMRGGNLRGDEARQIARQGSSAAPSDLLPMLAQALPPAAARVLDAGLVSGHCGKLPAAAVPRMRDAQAARDLAMAEALLRAAGEHAGPTVLIAGNGHVRRDHGVPLWLDRLRPTAKVVSVGFLEIDPDGSLPAAAERAPYDIVWVTPRAPRSDPCAGFAAPPGSP